jgi:hypothetical protein
MSETSILTVDSVAPATVEPLAGTPNAPEALSIRLTGLMETKLLLKGLHRFVQTENLSLTCCAPLPPSVPPEDLSAAATKMLRPQ